MEPPFEFSDTVSQSISTLCQSCLQLVFELQMPMKVFSYILTMTAIISVKYVLNIVSQEFFILMVWW